MRGTMKSCPLTTPKQEPSACWGRDHYRALSGIRETAWGGATAGRVISFWAFPYQGCWPPALYKGDNSEAL